jgi:hypothetical protein
LINSSRDAPQDDSSAMTSVRTRVLACIFFASAADCSRVMPYERGRLAHPTMTTADLAGAAEAHARAIQEGATGGGFEVGGGCGCN